VTVKNLFPSSLSQLKAEEWRSFKKFLLSNGKSNSIQIQLYQYIKERKGKAADKVALYKKIYPASSFDDVKIRKALSRFRQSYLSFIQSRSIMENKELQVNASTVLKKIGESKLYEKRKTALVRNSASMYAIES